MEYSEEFKQKVLSYYNNDVYIKAILDKGEDYLGSILYNDATKNFSAEEIIKAYQSKNLEPLYEEAKKRLGLLKLFYEWQKIVELKYQEYLKNMNKLNL